MLNNVHLKQQAINLRRKGFTYSAIEKELGVNRSTLSGWLKNLPLSEAIRRGLQESKQEHLHKMRGLAVLANHRKQEEKRALAKTVAQKMLAQVSLTSEVQAALLAMLYLGEGFKMKSCIGLGNSNPKILCVFIELLQNIFHVEKDGLRCILYLRYDQNPEKEKTFWSAILQIPTENFGKSQVDKRTLGKKTWAEYHGVCAIYCYRADIEKQLTELQRELMEKILRARSSDG